MKTGMTARLMSDTGQADLQPPSSGKFRVVRGGSWVLDNEDYLPVRVPQPQAGPPQCQLRLSRGKNACPLKFYLLTP